MEKIVNKMILLLSNKHIHEEGQWVFQPTDTKELGDISFSNPVANKFIKGFRHLVEVCTATYAAKFQQKWRDTIVVYRHANNLLHSRYKFEL